MLRRHPVGFFANEERDGRDAGRNHAALAFGGIFKRRRMWRQASPPDRTRQTKLIEPLGIVIRYPPRENVALPGIGGHFEALQLSQNLESAALAAHLRLRGNVLPAQQPP